MIDAGHEETEKELALIEKKIINLYWIASVEVNLSWKSFLTKIGEEISDLQKQYDAAKDSGDKTAVRKLGIKLAQLKRKRTFHDSRYKALTEHIADVLADANGQALTMINGMLPEIYTINSNFTATQIEGQIKGVSFQLTDASTVRNLVENGDTSLLPMTKRLDIDEDKRWNTEKMNGEVLQGIIQGESMDSISFRLMHVTDMNEKSAIRNARTMVTGAENKGRQDRREEAEKMGIILKKKWIATEDSRTRYSHSKLNGETIDADDTFSNGLLYPGDPDGAPAEVYNCLCTVGDIVVGFRKG